MLKILVKTCLQERSTNLLTRALTTDTVTKKEKWDLLTSVCLERKPVLTPTLNKIELDFKAYLSQVEYERSLKSDHEIRHENDIRKKAELLKKDGTADLEIDGAQLQTAQDFKDLCTEELSKFQFESRTTEADKSNDLQSLERKLDRYLVLVTENKIGKKSFFLPPQGTRMDGERLAQTVERILKENCGDDVKTKIYGNAPVGFYKYKYPKDVQTTNGAVGAKVFIYFARYLNGKMSEKSKFKWLDRQELAKEIPKDFHSSLAKMLIDDFPMQQKETIQESLELKTKTKVEDKKLGNKLKLDTKKSKVEQSTKQNIKTDEKLTKNQSVNI